MRGLATAAIAAAALLVALTANARATDPILEEPLDTPVALPTPTPSVLEVVATPVPSVSIAPDADVTESGTTSPISGTTAIKTLRQLVESVDPMLTPLTEVVDRLIAHAAAKVDGTAVPVESPSDVVQEPGEVIPEASPSTTEPAITSITANASGKVTAPTSRDAAGERPSPRLTPATQVGFVIPESLTSGDRPVAAVSAPIGHLPDTPPRADPAPRLPVPPLAVALGSVAAVAVVVGSIELVKWPTGIAAGTVFNDWLRRQLKEKRISQRQLAQQSGLNHSTISRLLHGDREPSLGTATKLARGLREIPDDEDGPRYFGAVAQQRVIPTLRVEYALRGDDMLDEEDVRHLMGAYHALRRGRMRRRVAPPDVDGGRDDAATRDRVVMRMQRADRSSLLREESDLESA